MNKKVKNYITMILEFNYLKNGRELSIAFLDYMVEMLKMTKDEEWR